MALGTVIEPGYMWDADREEYKHLVKVKWDESYDQTIPPQKAWGVVTVAPVSQTLLAQVLSREWNLSNRPMSAIPVDPVFAELAGGLERKGQVILYGPPGTGKTFTARRFAVWWLLRQEAAGAADRVLADDEELLKAELLLSTAPEGKVGHLTTLTFHASYSYEDFIEGFRPVDTDSGNLVLRLQDGLFKRICREALASPEKPYLVLIDEINRANVTKVLGELITLLEKDKRGLSVSLPQSKQSFTIPQTVYILGTMNTADRSIRLLDAALRRRFAFVELMPDASLLRGAKVGNLALDEFLEKLNRSVVRRVGREKQIGHSFLMEGAAPVSDPQEFARRFRQEILPLLQEYCYDDYTVLADYLGSKLVSAEGQVLDQDILGSPERLIEALEEKFNEEGPTS